MKCGRIAVASFWLTNKKNPLSIQHVFFHRPPMGSRTAGRRAVRNRPAITGRTHGLLTVFPPIKIRLRLLLLAIILSLLLSPGCFNLRRLHGARRCQKSVPNCRTCT